MRNLKRYLAVVVVIAMMFSLLVPVVTAESEVMTSSEAATILNDLDLYKGLSETEFVPDLGSTLNRQTAVVMLLRMAGVEDDALDMTEEEVTEALSAFTDANDIDTWAANQVAYAVQNDVVKGFQNGSTFTFQPKGLLTTNQWSTLVLKQMGYEVAEFSQASMQFAITSKATPAEISAFGSASGVMNKGQLVLMAHKALATVMSGTETTLIQELINSGNVDADAAMDAGFEVTEEPTVAPTPTTAPVVVEKVTSVVATNGKLTVVMDTAVTPAAVAADFSVVKKVYDMADASVVATVYSYDATTKTAVLNFTPVAAAAADQKVTFAVAYKTGTPVASNEVTVAAGFAVNMVNAINGTTKVALSGATGVYTNAPFEVMFSGAFDIATVDSNSVIVANKTTGAQIPGTWSYDLVNNKAIFYPSAALAVNAVYTFDVKATVKNVDKTSSVTPVSYSFTTGNLVTVTTLTSDNVISEDGDSTDTADNDGILELNETVVVTFSDDVDASTVNTSTFKLYNVTQSKYIAEQNGVIAISGKTATFAVGTSQNLNERYRVVVSGVKDLSGANVGDYQREFVTGTSVTPVMQALSPASPAVFPRIMSATIQDEVANQIYVQGFKLVYTFTANMAAATFNTNTVQIRESGSTVGVASNVSFDANSNTLTITPVSNLKDSTDYSVYFDINTIKTLAGMAITDPSTSFTTGDYLAPTVVSTEPALNATSVIEDSKFKITFNEAVSNVAGSTTQNYSATESVLLLNSSGDGIDISGAVSRENSNKTIVIDATNLALARATTYSIKLNGGSSSSLKVTDTSSALAQGSIPLASEYILTFTTRNSDTSAPTVESVKIGTSFTNSTVLANATKDVSITTTNNKKMYVLFSELLDNDGTPDILADNSADAVDDGNVIIESRAYDATSWTQIAYGAATATVTNDLQINKSYIEIPNAALSTTPTGAYEFRLRVKPTAGAGVVQDEDGNDLGSQYTFTFFRTGTDLGWTPVTAGTNFATNLGNGVSRDAALTAIVAGNGAAANEVAGTAVKATTANVSTGDVVGIQQNDGSFFFTRVKTGIAPITALAEDLPASGSGAPTSAIVINMTTNNSSISNLESGVAKNVPFAIKIKGNAGSIPDVSTINTTNITIKAGTNPAVDAKVTYRQIGNDIYVSIKPTGDLGDGKTYTLSMAGIKDTLGNTIPNASTTFTVASSTTDPLEVLSVTPVAGVDATVNSKIVIKFNEDITAHGAGSLVDNAAAVIAYDSYSDNGLETTALVDANTATTSKAITLTRLGSPDVLMTGKVEVNADGDTVTVTPDGLLEAGENYSLQIGGGLRSEDDATTLYAQANNDVSKLKFSFTTEGTASVKPKIVSALFINNDAIDAAGVNDMVVLTFNTKMLSTTYDVVGEIMARTTLSTSGRWCDGTNNASVAWASDGMSCTITLGASPIIIPGATTVKLTSSVLSANAAGTVTVDTNATATITR